VAFTRRGLPRAGAEVGAAGWTLPLDAEIRERLRGCASYRVFGHGWEVKFVFPERRMVGCVSSGERGLRPKAVCHCLGVDCVVLTSS